MVSFLSERAEFHVVTGAPCLETGRPGRLPGRGVEDATSPSSSFLASGQGWSQGARRFGATFTLTSTYVPAAKLPDLGLGRESGAPGSPASVGGAL